VREDRASEMGHADRRRQRAGGTERTGLSDLSHLVSFMKKEL
jgi:hypothetical protein